MLCKIKLYVDTEDKNKPDYNDSNIEFTVLFYHEHIRMLCVVIGFGSPNECTHNIISLQKIPKLFPFAFWPGSMIDSQWLKLLMSRTNFHGPKTVRAI